MLPYEVYCRNKCVYCLKNAKFVVLTPFSLSVSCSLAHTLMLVSTNKIILPLKIHNSGRRPFESYLFQFLEKAPLELAHMFVVWINRGSLYDLKKFMNNSVRGIKFEVSKLPFITLELCRTNYHLSSGLEGLTHILIINQLQSY